MSSAAELETGRCYVAVGTERFKKLPYVELLLSKATERYCDAKVLPACARADVRTCFGRSEDGNRKERTKLLFAPFDFDFPLSSLRQHPGKRKLMRRNEVLQ